MDDSFYPDMANDNIYYIIDKINKQHNICDNLLKESDWTQTLDIQSIKSSEWINSWKNYRQQLRDIPEKYSNTTNFNSSSIDWPKKPIN